MSEPLVPDIGEENVPLRGPGQGPKELNKPVRFVETDHDAMVAMRNIAEQEMLEAKNAHVLAKRKVAQAREVFVQAVAAYASGGKPRPTRLDLVRNMVATETETRLGILNGTIERPRRAPANRWPIQSHREPYLGDQNAFARKGMRSGGRRAVLDHATGRMVEAYPSQLKGAFVKPPSEF